MSKILWLSVSLLLFSGPCLAQSEDLIGPETAKAFHHSPLSFNGKRFTTNNSPEVTEFNKDQPIAKWSKPNINELGTLRFGSEGDIIWLHEVRERKGPKETSGLYTETTTFENGKANTSTYCVGTKKTKAQAIALSCMMANRRTCDALFMGYGLERKKPKYPFPSFAKRPDGLTETEAAGIKCGENMKTEECVALVESYKNIVKLLKAEAQKAQKEIDGDLKLAKAETKNVFGKSIESVEVKSSMSQEALAGFFKDLDDSKPGVPALKAMAFVNTALNKCMVSHPHLNDTTQKPSASGSKGAPIPPAGGVK